MSDNENPQHQDEGAPEWEHTEGEPLEAEQLALADDEERLPWLESDDDEYDEDDDSGFGKLMGLVLGGLALLGALVGGIWWVTHRNPDPALVADGSTVPAPEGPYKEVPKDPGGKTFDGTGDSSFAVSEGQNRPAQLANGGAPANGGALPGVGAAAGAGGAASGGSAAGTNGGAGAAGAAGSANGAAAGSAGGVGVQVGAFSSQAAAEAGWARLVGKAGSTLSGVQHRIVAGKADIGTVYRLQAVAGDAGAANALCGKLKGAGIPCQVK